MRITSKKNDALQSKSRGIKPKTRHIIPTHLHTQRDKIGLEETTKMGKWELITEVKDTGYYIGWRRVHKMIHMPEPMEPMGKTSLVQIGGNTDGYQVHGITFAHSVFEPHKAGLKLFDRIAHCATLAEAETKATELKRTIAKMFDDVTHSDSTGKLILRENATS